MKIKEIEVFRPACHVDATFVSARAHLDADVSHLMPYLNAVMDDAQYFVKGPFIRFRWNGRLVTVEPYKFAVGAFADDGEAREFAKTFFAKLEELEEGKDSIEPNHKPYDPPPAMEVFKLLPKKSGCGECGFPTCMAFAVAVSKGEAAPDKCPELCGGAGLGKITELLG